VAGAFLLVLVCIEMDLDVHPHSWVYSVNYDKWYYATVITKGDKAIISFAGGNHVPVTWEDRQFGDDPYSARDSRGHEWIIEFPWFDGPLRGMAFFLLVTSVVVTTVNVIIIAKTFWRSPAATYK